MDFLIIFSSLIYHDIHISLFEMVSKNLYSCIYIIYLCFSNEFQIYNLSISSKVIDQPINSTLSPPIQQQQQQLYPQISQNYPPNNNSLPDSRYSQISSPILQSPSSSMSTVISNSSPFNSSSTGSSSISFPVPNPTPNSNSTYQYQPQNNFYPPLNNNYHVSPQPHQAYPLNIKIPYPDKC